MRDQVRSILFAEDDELLLQTLRQMSRLGVEVHTATNSADARALARAHRPQVVFADLQLGNDDGLSLLGELRAEFPEMRLYLMSGYGSISSAVAAMRLGVIDVLTKPFSLAELIALLDPQWRPHERHALETPSVERTVWEHVHRVLRDCNGNKSEAARRLKKPRSWIRRFLAKTAPRG
jgi:two-component system response regulator RegA